MKVSRPSVSSGLSAKPSARAITNAAERTPRQPAWNSATDRSSVTVTPADNAASATTSASACGEVRAMSTTVRGRDVTRHPLAYARCSGGNATALSRPARLSLGLRVPTGTTANGWDGGGPTAGNPRTAAADQPPAAAAGPQASVNARDRWPNAVQVSASVGSAAAAYTPLARRTRSPDPVSRTSRDLLTSRDSASATLKTPCPARSRRLTSSGRSRMPSRSTDRAARRHRRSRKCGQRAAAGRPVDNRPAGGEPVRAGREPRLTS
ncbi:hypothetical protein SAMN04488561_3388 [Jiangella alba]|uniref:Uncharacterized protein n=1 Tax=Jiangella alba TaxID=561176 RepID=A0A1H5MSM0_9ACTN|nr:hypothetical protein SAMN04488561_3388 [Jiangella alba]